MCQMHSQAGDGGNFSGPLPLLSLNTEPYGILIGPMGLHPFSLSSSCGFCSHIWGLLSSLVNDIAVVQELHLSCLPGNL